MSDRVEKILKLLHKCDRAELEEVQRHCQALKEYSPTTERSTPKAVDENELCLYTVLTARLRGVLTTKYAPFQNFTSTADYTAFHLAAQQVVSLHEQWFPKHTKLERISTLTFFANVIFDYMVRNAWPLFWPSVCKAMSLLPTIIERQFPGYQHAGLLLMVMKMRTEGARNGDTRTAHRDAASPAGGES